MPAWQGCDRLMACGGYKDEGPGYPGWDALVELMTLGNQLFAENLPELRNSVVAMTALMLQNGQC